MRNLPDNFAKRVLWQKSETVFRFGNNDGTLASLGAVFIPFGRRWLELEVVDGTTPFLLSNAFLKAVAADICTSRKMLCVFHGKVSVPLDVSEKGLFSVDLVEILRHAQVEDLHGESWEVVTNMIDEKKKKEKRKRKTLTHQYFTTFTHQQQPSIKRVREAVHQSRYRWRPRKPVPPMQPLWGWTSLSHSQKIMPWRWHRIPTSSRLRNRQE